MSEYYELDAVISLQVLDNPYDPMVVHDVKKYLGYEGELALHFYEGRVIAEVPNGIVLPGCTEVHILELFEVLRQ